jgi:hypothetical protein
MPISEENRAELDRLGTENVRLQLAHAGPSRGSVVPGLGKRPDQQFGMTRGDVEDWLAEQTREAARQQADILWWAKAAAFIGLLGIIVAIVIAFLGK